MSAFIALSGRRVVTAIGPGRTEPGESVERFPAAIAGGSFDITDEGEEGNELPPEPPLHPATIAASTATETNAIRMRDDINPSNAKETRDEYASYRSEPFTLGL
jgi:hypothetical protein